MKRTVFTAILSLSLLCSTSVQAQQLGLDFTGYSGTTTDPYTMGYFFTVLNPITVSALGYFDDGKDGLVSSHDVGIWSTSSHTLLAFATIGSGTGNALDSWYRMAGILPTLLTPGGYVVGGTTESDNWIGTNFSTVTGTTVHPDIIVDAAAWHVGGTFAEPDHSHTINPPAFYGGANFAIAGSVVPEPATIMLLGTGMLGIAGLARRRQKSG